MAPAGDTLLNRFDAPLPCCDSGVWRSAVFEEVERSTWPEDTPDLGEGSFDVGNRAQREGAERSIACVGVEWNGRAVEPDVLDTRRGGGDPRFGESSGDARRFDGVDEGDLGWIRLHVETGTEPDLEDRSRESLRDAGPPAVHLPRSARTIDQPWQDDISVHTHDELTPSAGSYQGQRMGRS